MNEIFFASAADDTLESAWNALRTRTEGYARAVDRLPIAPTSRSAARSLDEAPLFETPRAIDDVLGELADGLAIGQTHVGARRYFGLWNTAVTVPSVLAEALVLAHNPQLATRMSAPFATEIEWTTLRAIARELDYPMADAHFASGGAEANHTAVLAALSHVFPSVGERGVRALPADPVAYVSAEAHHSIHKAMRAAGLGEEALRIVPLDIEQRLRVDKLHDLVNADRKAGKVPFLFVVTLGTTSAGTVEPLAPMLSLARKHGAWLHADAAFGGMLAFASPGHEALASLKEADSVTFDAHKALHVPIGAGVLFTKHADVLRDAFHVASGYMPHVAASDVFARSLTWSRRFTGAKVYASLATLGMPTVRRMAAHMQAMGEHLQSSLCHAGFRQYGTTPLPVCAFSDEARGRGPAELCDLARERENAWISIARLSSGLKVARAGICHARTERDDVDALVRALS